MNILSLPKDLVVRILSRLPVKSVLRCKCVCKSWLFLISDPEFAKLHFDLALDLSDRLLLRFTGNDYIESIDTEAPLTDSSATLNLRLPPLPYRRGGSGRGNVLQFWGSCRGFLLLYLDTHTLIVWNPTTGVHTRIPESNTWLVMQYLCGFGYDASTDDYLVTFIRFIVRKEYYPKRHAMIKLFSLKSNSWDCSYIDIENPYREHQRFDLKPEFKAGLFLNGALHWLVDNGNDRVRVIIAFDLVERSLSEIPLPPLATNGSKLSLRVIGGCLSVWCLTSSGRGKIWMMKEYKVSSWTRSFDLDCHFRIFTPICLTKDNAIFGSNLDCEKLEKFCGETQQWLSEHLAYGRGPDKLSRNLHLAPYRESLLSLPTRSREISSDD